MSDTAQIVLTVLMILIAILGWFHAYMKNQPMTTFCMGVALILGVMLF